MQGQTRCSWTKSVLKHAIRSCFRGGSCCTKESSAGLVSRVGKRSMTEHHPDSSAPDPKRHGYCRSYMSIQRPPAKLCLTSVHRSALLPHNGVMLLTSRLLADYATSNLRLATASQWQPLSMGF